MLKWIKVSVSAGGVNYKVGFKYRYYVSLCPCRSDPPTTYYQNGKSTLTRQRTHIVIVCFSPPLILYQSPLIIVFQPTIPLIPTVSHLIGLYPGYAITSYSSDLQGGVLVNGTNITYTKDQVIAAATTSLIHRGNGTGPDADAGWEKAWRAACWAQLGNAEEFYHELTVSQVIHSRYSELFSEFREIPCS